MNAQSVDYEAVIRDAHRLRSRAVVEFWRAVKEALSLHVPRLFPAEF